MAARSGPQKINGWSYADGNRDRREPPSKAQRLDDVVQAPKLSEVNKALPPADDIIAMAKGGFGATLGVGPLLAASSSAQDNERSVMDILME